MFSHGGGGPIYICECCILLHCLCIMRVLQSFTPCYTGCLFLDKVLGCTVCESSGQTVTRRV
jgi:hypothetical protein